MQVRSILIGTVFISSCLISDAFTQQPDVDQKSHHIEEQDQEAPSLEFLEFLGQWETEDGRWIDPEELDKMPLPEPEQNDEHN